MLRNPLRVIRRAPLSKFHLHCSPRGLPFASFPSGVGDQARWRCLLRRHTATLNQPRCFFSLPKAISLVSGEAAEPPPWRFLKSKSGHFFISISLTSPRLTAPSGPLALVRPCCRLAPSVLCLDSPLQPPTGVRSLHSLGPPALPLLFSGRRAGFLKQPSSPSAPNVHLKQLTARRCPGPDPDRDRMGQPR